MLYPLITDEAVRSAVDEAHSWIRGDPAATLNETAQYCAWQHGCSRPLVRGHVSARLAIDGVLEEVLSRPKRQKPATPPGQMTFAGL
ncbi:MAG: hypothetical protein HDQ87_06275 [Clostridia bacterium]|nr:hypothetical protein [Clostridia bacterium]